MSQYGVRLSLCLILVYFSPDNKITFDLKYWWTKQLTRKSITLTSQVGAHPGYLQGRSSAVPCYNHRGNQPPAPAHHHPSLPGLLRLAGHAPPPQHTHGDAGPLGPPPHPRAIRPRVPGALQGPFGQGLRGERWTSSLPLRRCPAPPRTSAGEVSPCAGRSRRDGVIDKTLMTLRNRSGRTWWLPISARWELGQRGHCEPEGGLRSKECAASGNTA